MMSIRRRVGALLYGLFFAMVLPFALAAWANVLDTRLALPAPHFPIALATVALAGAAIALAGAAVMVAGMWTLVALGGGLPMNAFPPPRFVRGGIFRWVSNPIYLGFGCIVLGASLFTGSIAGLFVVTPVVILAMIALVAGYERPDLLRRFGNEARRKPLLSIPAALDEPPTAANRAVVLLCVLLPWVLVYYGIQALGAPPDRIDLSFAFERTWPVMQWTEALYASIYLQVPLAVFIATSRMGLRRFAIAGAVSTIVVGVCWLVIPAVVVHRPFTPAGPLGELLAFEQAQGNGTLSFPAFHVLWALLAADAWSDRARSSARAAWRALGFLWAIAIAVSTLTTGMHYLLDDAAAVLVYFLVREPDALWQRLRGAAERLANSWREWRFGPMRVINHGAYAFAGAGVFVLVAGTAIGPAHTLSVVWVGACILVGSGLWAQWLEGSSHLLRPFGWYGGMAGALIGAITARAAGVPLLPLLASFAVAAPWLQILGRLRCLVQGCCHGGPASETVGIRYRHRRSRVTQLANLAGVAIHATPLYSILGNVTLGVLMARLRVIGAGDAFVLGAYLMLAGIARFVEESFRAEPQTPRVAGLPVYQWFAIASLAGGMIVSALPSVPRAGGFAAPTPPLVLGALALALLAGFALGVDFPNSNARFSRLAGAD
jgi:protein-S-isoprenylcysteine O-methyltransferase Ste14